MSNRTQLCEIRLSLFDLERRLGEIRRSDRIDAAAAARLARAEEMVRTVRTLIDGALTGIVDGPVPAPAQEARA